MPQWDKARACQGIGLRQRDAFPKGAFKAFPELGGGAAGKGNGKDALSGDAVLEEALDAAHKGAGFAGTGAREYQHGGWPGLDGFLLRLGIRERLRIGAASGAPGASLPRTGTPVSMPVPWKVPLWVFCPVFGLRAEHPTRMKNDTFRSQTVCALLPRTL